MRSDSDAGELVEPGEIRDPYSCRTQQRRQKIYI